MKNKITTVLGTFLLLIGLLFIFNPSIKNIFVGNGSEQLALTSVNADMIEANQEKEASFDFAAVENLDLQTSALANFNREDIAIIGGIAIPRVGLNLPIGKGTAPYTLALTAGSMKPDQVMGEGNYALAGHNMVDPNLLFSPVLEVQLGDIIYLTDLTTIYEYQVIEQSEVAPTDVHVIEDQPGKKVLTLITCDDTLTKRLLTVAEFVQEVPIEEASTDAVNAFQLELTNQ